MRGIANGRGIKIGRCDFVAMREMAVGPCDHAGNCCWYLWQCGKLLLVFVAMWEIAIDLCGNAGN